MRRLTTLLITLLIMIGSCVHEPMDSLEIQLIQAIQGASPTGELRHYIFPESNDYQNLPNQDPANPVTEAKVKLGNLLFFETGLAQIPKSQECYETYSCATCHVPTAGFLPGRTQGIADGGFGFGYNGGFRSTLSNYADSDLDAQGTRPMNPVNSGYSTVTLWSGLFGATGPNEGTDAHWTGIAEVNHTGYVGLEAQNIEGFKLHRLAINEKVLDTFGYRELFDNAFLDFPEEERYSPTTSSFAISAFLRSLLANRAPFQEWLKGDNQAMTEDQKKGALLFFGKAKCTNCHKGPALNAMEFHALGTADLYEAGGLNTGPDDLRNLGRGMLTGKAEDMYRFKVPQLYNLKDYATFFHGSSKQSLEEVVEFKLRAVSENPNVDDANLSTFFNPITLTEEEKSNLIDFLRNALYDDAFHRYVPESVPSGNCFPNNDPISQEDLGCK